jgi:hypothetical protein
MVMMHIQMLCTTTAVGQGLTPDPFSLLSAYRRLLAENGILPEGQGSIGTDIVPFHGSKAMGGSEVDPLYLLVCGFEWRAERRKEAIWELVSALASSNAGTRLVAESLLKECQ